MNSRIAAICLGAIASAVLAAGCGTEEQNEYVDTVNEIQVRATEAFNATAEATAREPKALLDELEANAAALDDALAELQAVDVPEEAQEGHSELVAGFEQLSDLFDSFAGQLGSASTSEAFSAVTEFGGEAAEIGTQIDQAIDRINQDLGAE